MSTDTQRHDVEVLLVGNELLRGERRDAHLAYIGQAVQRAGVKVDECHTVGDDIHAIASRVRDRLPCTRVLIVTGGLGPTVDDCTREAVAKATGRRLARRKAALDGMTARLAQWGRQPNKGQLRQATIPAGATVVTNPVGSAPGFLLEWKGATLVSLPGVPREMEAMMTESVIPFLADQLARSTRTCPQPITRQVFHTWGLPEADVDAKLQGLIPKRAPVDLGLLASPMGVLVSLTTKSGGAGPVSDEALSSLAQDVRTRLSDCLFAEGRETMEEVVGRLLAGQKRTVALAESCTGGLIGHRLTQVPGSSAYVDRGAICYSNQSKSEMLGVSVELIAKHGAVSREVAAAMAKGIRELAGVSVGLSVTGIAGPGGATATKPVGLVYVGLDGGAGGAITREFRFHGDRSVIKQRSSQAALNLLRLWLIDRGRT